MLYSNDMPLHRQPIKSLPTDNNDNHECEPGHCSNNPLFKPIKGCNSCQRYIKGLGGKPPCGHFEYKITPNQEGNQMNNTFTYDETKSARLLLDLDRAAKDYGLKGKSITYFDRLEDIRNNVERQLEELWEIESS